MLVTYDGELGEHVSVGATNIIYPPNGNLSLDFQLLHSLSPCCPNRKYFARTLLLELSSFTLFVLCNIRKNVSDSHFLALTQIILLKLKTSP